MPQIVYGNINKTLIKDKPPPLLQGQALRVFQIKFLLVIILFFKGVKFLFVKNLAIHPTHRFLVA